MVSASSCSVSGLPSASSVVPQTSAPLLTEQMSWSSASWISRMSGECIGPRITSASAARRSSYAASDAGT